MSGVQRMIILIVVAVVVLLAAFEILSPTLAERQARSNASDVATAAAHVLLNERDSNKPFDQISQEARNAANKQAGVDGVTLTVFTIDTNQRVHVTIVKQARSLIHISALRKYESVTVSATAAP